MYFGNRQDRITQYVRLKHVHTFIQSQGLTDIWHTQFIGKIWTVHLTTEDEVVVL